MYSFKSVLRVDYFDIVGINIVHNPEEENALVITISSWANYEHVVFLVIDDYIEVVPTLQKPRLSTYTPRALLDFL